MQGRERWTQPQQLMSSDIGTGGPSNEGESEIIPYSEIRGKGIGDPAVLGKFNMPGEFERAAREQLREVPPDVLEMFLSEKTYLPGRIKPHLLRMLARPGVEYDFAVGILNYAPPVLLEERKNQRQVNDILSSETTDTMMWWTFAPYIYKELLEKGVDQKAAVELILDWAKESPVADGGSKGDVNDRFNLKGLEMFNTLDLPRYALARNRDDLSHKFTAQEAKRIVRDVFGIKSKTE